jgi:hypothetical protein
VTEDRFMNSLRGEPRREFARRLWERLAPATPDEDRVAASRRFAPAFAIAAVAIAIASLFVFPSMRASAQAFLDLFRVRNFVAVSVDPARFERLNRSDLDLKKLIGDRLQVLEEPGPPVPYPSVTAAGTAAGIQAHTPSWMPAGFALDSVRVCGAGRARITADAARLRELMTLLDVRDIAIPNGVDGAVVEVHAWPAVQQTFRRNPPENDGPRATLIQARSPEVSMPAGLELARLAEIGLRMLGTPEADARRLAERTDWRSTLLVPVPADAGSFQEVDVDGARGLLVASRERSHRLILWSRGDQVFALGGTLSREDLLQMAGSVR